jgi:proteasome lid subunit RPN8/RPN11
VTARIRIASELLPQLLTRSCQESPREVCGLLAGRDGIITHALPATNAATDPAVSYEIASEELFRLMREMRAARLELLGIYHSHPNGKNEPSPRDVERAYYPDAACFIISPRSAAARPVRAFSIRDGHVIELEIHTETAKETQRHDQ